MGLPSGPEPENGGDDRNAYERSGPKVVECFQHLLTSFPEFGFGGRGRRRTLPGRGEKKTSFPDRGWDRVITETDRPP